MERKMLDIGKILNRAWHVLWNYRTLWIFGFILALAAGGNGFEGRGSYSSDGGQADPTAPDWAPEGWKIDNWDDLEGDTFPEKMGAVLRQVGAGVQELREMYPEEFRLGIAAAITLLIVILVFGVLITVLRYISETAVIRMVDEYESSGVKVGFRQAWKYGRTRAAWQVFLTDFVVHLPVLLLFVVLGLVGWWVVSALLSGIEWNVVSSVIAGSGLAVLSIFITVILMVVLYVLRDLAWRMIHKKKPLLSCLNQQTRKPWDRLRGGSAIAVGKKNR
jgi:hypothetical protein